MKLHLLISNCESLLSWAANAEMHSLLPHTISHARGIMLLCHVMQRLPFCRSLCVFCFAACGHAVGLEEEGRPAELFGPSPHYAQGCFRYAGKHSCPCCSLSAYMPNPAEPSACSTQSCPGVLPHSRPSRCKSSSRLSHQTAMPWYLTACHLPTLST